MKTVGNEALRKNIIRKHLTPEMSLSLSLSLSHSQEFMQEKQGKVKNVEPFRVCHGRFGQVSFAVILDRTTKQSHSRNDLDFKYLMVCILDLGNKQN